MTNDKPPAGPGVRFGSRAAKALRELYRWRDHGAFEAAVPDYEARMAACERRMEAVFDVMRLVAEQFDVTGSERDLAGVRPRLALIPGGLADGPPPLDAETGPLMPLTMG